MLEHVYFPKHARLSGQEDNNPDYGFWFQSFLELAELSAILFKGGADQHIDPFLCYVEETCLLPTITRMRKVGALRNSISNKTQGFWSFIFQANRRQNFFQSNAWPAVTEIFISSWLRPSWNYPKKQKKDFLPQ